jgi:hypothetical protein
MLLKREIEANVVREGGAVMCGILTVLRLAGRVSILQRQPSLFKNNYKMNKPMAVCTKQRDIPASLYVL